MVFPTSHKAKISKSMSYPIGAEALSAALEGVPQSALISLWFGHASTSIALRAGHASRYKILSAFYSHHLPNQFSANRLRESFYGPKWHLYVYEVPRQHRHAVRSLLDSEGLPRVGVWLRNMADITEREGHCQIDLILDEAQMTLQYETTVYRQPTTADNARS
jgi:hypothetical protein